MIALRDAILAKGYDCSSFISDEGMSLHGDVERRDARIVVRAGQDEGSKR